MDHSQIQNPADFIFPAPPELGLGSTREYYEKLLRGMAHKLNNQTSVVHGFASLLLMGNQLDQTTRDNIVHMKDSSNQMSALVNRVLVLGGCGRAAIQRIQLGEFLAMLDRPIRELMQENTVTYSCNVAANLPAINADPSRLRELLFELLRNAAQAAAAGNGQVALDACAPGQASPPELKQIDIFVRNSGQTLEPARIPQAFEPFTGTRGSEHFGLGLPTAAMLANLFGGRLGMRTANGTTTAWLMLPASD
jgi:signal transduction histidine kinase